MLNLLKALRQDEHGVILSAEIVIIGSLLVIGLITGVTCLQKSVNGELQDLAGAIGALDQTYSFSAHRKDGYAGQCCAYTAGSSFVNCENKDQKCGDIVGCTDACHVATEACGSCNNGSVTYVHESHTGCSSCRGESVGCTACGSGSTGVVSGKTSRCIETGVPGMKVTEWQGSRSSAQDTVCEPVIIHPAVESVLPPHHHSLPAQPEVIIQQPTYERPNHEQPSQAEPTIRPVPAAEPLPMPMPETPQVPALPMPPMT